MNQPNMNQSCRFLLVSGLLVGMAGTVVVPACAATTQQDAAVPSTSRAVINSAPAMAQYRYGADPLQGLDYWHATQTAPAPLVMFVHGGDGNGVTKRAPPAWPKSRI